jgi:hypothetical protein
MTTISTVEKYDYKDKEVIVVDAVSIEYSQSADCVSHDDDIQTIRIRSENNGTARFMVLETERWAISDIDDLIILLTDFKTRAGIE